MKAFWAAIGTAALKLAIWAGKNPQEIVAIVQAGQTIQKEVK